MAPQHPVDHIDDAEDVHFRQAHQQLADA
jgi:hypothetical protein